MTVHDTKRINAIHAVASRLIEALEHQLTPWQQPWKSHASMRPMNPTTGQPYRGINRVLLGLQGGMTSDGLVDNRWMTFQQAMSRGWGVHKGAKGTLIIKAIGLPTKEVEDPSLEEDRPTTDRKPFMLKHYFVFNGSQIEGLPPLQAAPTPSVVEVAERADAVLTALREKTRLRITHGGDRAFYVPSHDIIHLPHQGQFNSVYDYYATALHEAAHATMHEKRLNRRHALGERFGDEAYAMEELRAEMCSAILASEAGLCTSPEAVQAHLNDHAAYLQSWIARIKDQPMAAVSAAKEAEAMATYLLALAPAPTLSQGTPACELSLAM
ncbi:ArdC family protein [Roseateles chitinivorans]|nr:zincin-like metallopeptidase domain-containing protein [Roseateles chitinivorans]